jgi:hypothetical protein
MGILASYGLFYIVRKRFESRSSIIIYLLVLILSLSSISLVSKDIGEIKKDSLKDYYYHLLDSEILAINWLKANSTSKQGIMTNWFYGNIIPGMTG